jgi:hypothetical protein
MAFTAFWMGWDGIYMTCIEGFLFFLFPVFQRMGGLRDTNRQMMGGLFVASVYKNTTIAFQLDR